MSYEKHKWVPYDETLSEEENIKLGAVITSPKLNEIEDGIEGAHTDIAAVNELAKKELKKHLDDLANPHKTTAEQVGAYSTTFLDTVANGFRMFDKSLKNVNRISDTYDLAKMESLDWTYIDKPINAPEDFSNPAGWVLKTLTNTSMGVIFIANNTNRRVYFGNAFGGTALVWNRAVNFNELNTLLYGPWTTGSNANVTYAGKIGGSTVANPHRAENTQNAVVLIPFTIYSEFIQGSYDRIKSDDATEYVNSIDTAGNTIQVALPFNIKEQVARDYPMTKNLLWSQVSKMMTSIKIEVWACGAGGAGNSVTLSRVSAGKAPNPTYVDEKSNTATTPTLLEWTTASQAGIEAITNDTGMTSFLVRSRAASATVQSSIRIRFVRLSYTLNLTNLIDTIFNSLNDPENRYRTSLTTGVIPQNPTWVSKNLQDNNQLDHDWVYINTLTNFPNSETSSGYVKRSRVGTNIQTVWFRAFNSETVYKSSKLNADVWTNWEPDDGNGWKPNNASITLTELPVKPMSQRYVTLAAVVAPIGANAVGFLNVYGVNTRLVAEFVTMGNLRYTNTYIAPSWTGWKKQDSGLEKRVADLEAAIVALGGSI